MNQNGPTAAPYIIPMLICRDAASEIAFCGAAFGAVELTRRTGPDDTTVHATLSIGGTLVMVHCESPHLASLAPVPDASSPVVIYHYVDDVDDTVERAVIAGARVVLPAANQVWGDRVARIIDPAGHVWNIAARVSVVT